MVLPPELTSRSVDLKTHSHIMLRLKIHELCLDCLINFHDVVFNRKDRFFITDSLVCISLEASKLTILEITQF